MIIEFLVAGLLLPLLLIAVALGLERVEEELNRSVPPDRRRRPAADRQEESRARSAT